MCFFLRCNGPTGLLLAQYFTKIDDILDELSSRFSQPAMKTLEFIKTIILDAATVVVNRVGRSSGNGVGVR